MALTLHDAALAARDPALPGLGLVLDADGLAAELEGLLPDAGIEALRPTYLRYKPGTSCLAGFVAETAGGAIDLAAKACKPRSYAVEQDRPLPEGLRSRLGPVALGLDAPAILIRFVPYDRELKSLPRLVDPAGRRRLLDKLVPDLAAADWQQLRHKPGRRHIGLLKQDGSTQAIVKHYAPDDFAQARLGARLAERLGEVALLGASTRHGILASAWQPGICLAELDPDDPRTRAAVVAAATVLAAVHSERSGELLSTTLDAEAEAIHATACSLSTLLPDLAERATRLADQIGCLLFETSGRMVPLHGDFSADQVVVQQTGVRLIDWDRATIGPAALDLGSFIARLEMDARQAGRPRPKLLIEAFDAAYAAATGARPSGVRNWTAAALFRLAVEPFRSRRADWPKLTRAIIERVAQHVERALHRSPRRRTMSA
jgi:hypothetical protein